MHESLVPEDIYFLADQFFLKGSDSVDVGCGIGRDTHWLSEHGYPAIGIDASEAMLIEGKRRFPTAQFVQDCLPLLSSISDGFFANVLCSAVIMHLSDDEIEPAICNLLRIAGSSAIIILSFRGSNEENHREGGKLYTHISKIKLIELLKNKRAKLVHDEDKQEASRGLQWHNLVFAKY